MSRRARLGLFALGGPGLAAVMVIGLLKLPRFGHYHGVYGLLLARIGVPLRHATDLVTALNFDIRAFDTLGEEFILFASVAGVALLLRRIRSEHEEDFSQGIEDHRFSGASPLLHVVSRAFAPLLVALGGYVVVHGALTPGGGFQGGVVLAAGPIGLLLAGRYLALKRVAPHWAIEVVECTGAAGYALMGLGGLVFASAYFANFLPLGTPGKLLSAGTIPINSVAVAMEVTGAFLVIWTEFLDQALMGANAEGKAA